jgi:hypothetical protein
LASTDLEGITSMLNDDQLKLAGLISCPVDWTAICLDEDFSTWLRYLWFKVVQEHKIDSEELLLSSHDWEPDEVFILNIYADSAITWPMEQVESWIEAARRGYEKRYGRFRRLRVASRTVYPKHLCHPDATDAQVARQSVRTGDSALYPRISELLQTRFLWTAISKIWMERVRPYEDDSALLIDSARVVEEFDVAFPLSTLRIPLETDHPVGCVLGRPSRFLVVEVNFSTPVAHIYPISLAEAEKVGMDSVVYVGTEDLGL